MLSGLPPPRSEFRGYVLISAAQVKQSYNSTIQTGIYIHAYSSSSTTVAVVDIIDTISY